MYVAISESARFAGTVCACVIDHVSKRVICASWFLQRIAAVRTYENHLRSADDKIGSMQFLKLLLLFLDMNINYYAHYDSVIHIIKIDKMMVDDQHT